MSMKLWSRTLPTRRRAVGLVAVLLGILLLRFALDVWAGSRLRSVAERIAPAYGGRLDAASLAPPAVRPGENRARIASAAASLADLPPGPTRSVQLSSALSDVPYMDPSARLAIFRLAASENRLALQVLDGIESRPKANWEIQYADGFRMRLPALMAIRDLSNVNVAAGRIALADGNADEAARRARLGIVLAGSLAQEPNLLIQLIHVGISREPLRLVRDVLAAGEPSAAALEALAGRLDEGRAADAAVTGLVGELKVIHGTLDSVEGGAEIVGGDRDGFWSRALAWFLRPAVRAAHARTLDELDQLIRYARLPAYERETQARRSLSDEPQPWWWRKLAPVMLGGLGRAVVSVDEQRASLMLASTAVALRRCRLEHGSYPEHLDELNPIYLPAPPVDPYTGRMPEYARQAAGFVLKVTVPSGTQAAAAELMNWSIPR